MNTEHDLVEALDCLEAIVRSVDPEQVEITRERDKNDYEKAERVLNVLVKHQRMIIKEKTAEKTVYSYVRSQA